MNIAQMFKRVLIFAQLIIVTSAAVQAIHAQASSVDPSFNAVVSTNKFYNNVLVEPSFKLQPDGKVIVYGSFLVVNGVVKVGVARLNADGNLDNSFNCTSCKSGVGSVLIQPDGKIIFADSQVKRLNADGSLDGTFNYELNTANGVEALQPDGKIIVSSSGYSGPNYFSSIYRLNADGSPDSTFTTINLAGGRMSYQTIGKVVVASNGKIYLTTNICCTGSGGATITRYNSDGTRDTTYESPTFSGSFGVFISDFELAPDGSLVAVGTFEKVNGLDRINVVKILSAGNVDLSFAPGNVYDTAEKARGIEIFSNGQILISTTGIGNMNSLVRLNTDGSRDNTFIKPNNFLFVIDFVIDSADNVFAYGDFNENNQIVKKFARLNMNGGLISSFSAYFGIGGSISTLALQSDGKVLIAGSFIQIGAVVRNNIARLNADGSLDPNFDPGSGLTGTINKIFVQSDGKILVGGNFSAYNGTARAGLIRLNTDGSLDNSFNVGFTNNPTIYAITQQADGKILFGGSFDSVNGQTRAGIARVNADGSLDTGFNPIFGSPIIYAINVLSDTKILVGGSFNGVNGFNRNSLVKLNTDGTLDTAFTANNIGVKDIQITVDGKYLVLGNTINRLNTDGSVDSSFQPPTFNSSTSSFLYLDALLAQPDGSILVGGNFTTVNGVARLRLARLKSDGTLDLLFNQGGANDRVRALVRQPDGKVLAGGDFSIILNTVRLGVARLVVNQVVPRVTLFDFDGDGRADVSLFRPSNGVWYVLPSQSNSFYGQQFGISTDKLAPADYDGDGKTDLAVFRENINGQNGKTYFYILNSSNGAFRQIQFGADGDLPMSGDWDGDGTADVAVYRDGSRTGTGQSYFYYHPSSQTGVGYKQIQWGSTGDVPVAGDFDGDGKRDAAIFRPSLAQWYILRSATNQVLGVQFGLASDILTPADYNGDGKTDFGVFRPSNGYWYYSSSQTNPSTDFTGIQFGTNGDVPAPADYDGDGKADVAVFRPSSGIWYVNRTTQGFYGVQFGASQDKPAPNAYIR